MKNILIFLISILIFSCSNAPKVEKNFNFSLNKYLGKWYEIKRFDHSFEKNLKDVTANYSLESNGKISVINRGINLNGEEKTFYAFAKQTNTPNFLKVYPKFFPIFGAPYNIAWISDDYKYAIVTSNSYNYLWFLSREKNIPFTVYEFMLNKASSLGFNTNKLIDGQ